MELAGSREQSNTQKENISDARSLITCKEYDIGRQLFGTGQFSDLKITCQGETFYVHKTIMIERGGEIFNTAICSGFAESVSSVIDMPEDDPKILVRVLLWIYTKRYYKQLRFKDGTRYSHLKDESDIDGGGSDEHVHVNGYDVADASDATEQHSDVRSDRQRVKDLQRAKDCEIHLYVYATASKCMLESLKAFTCHAFCSELDFWFRDIHGTRCFNEINFNDVHTIFQLVYDTTGEQDHAIRDAVAFYMSRERDQCYCKPTGSKAVVDLFRQVPEIGVELACATVFYTKDHQWFCRCCGVDVGVVIRPCACDNIGVCEKKECMTEYEKNLVYTECGGVGKLITTAKQTQMEEDGEDWWSD